MVGPLFSVSPHSLLGRLVSPSGKEGQSEHLRNASESFNQSLWHSGTGLWAAGLGRGGLLSDSESDWTVPEPNTELNTGKLPGPTLLRSPQATRGMTTISSFPFSIIPCSLRFLYFFFLLKDQNYAELNLAT